MIWPSSVLACPHHHHRLFFVVAEGVVNQCSETLLLRTLLPFRVLDAVEQDALQFQVVACLLSDFFHVLAT